MSPHQKSVRIHRIRRTRNQRYMIIPIRDTQRLCLLRKNGKNLIHLVGKRLTQHMQVKNISLFHKIQICKKFRTWKSSVCRQNTMGTLAANRKTAAEQMTGTLLQRLICRVMIDWNAHIDHRNLHIPHHSITIQVQKRLICTVRLAIPHGKSIRHTFLLDLFVILLCCLPHTVNLLRIIIRRNTAAIITDQQAVPVPVPGITDHWIQQYGQPYQKQQTKSNIIFLLILSHRFLHTVVLPFRPPKGPGGKRFTTMF